MLAKRSTRNEGQKLEVIQGDKTHLLERASIRRTYASPVLPIPSTGLYPRTLTSTGVHQISQFSASNTPSPQPTGFRIIDETPLHIIWRSPFTYENVGTKITAYSLFVAVRVNVRRQNGHRHQILGPNFLFGSSGGFSSLQF